MHSTLAVTNQRTLLGLLTQAFFTRLEGELAHRQEECRNLPIEQKESYRWSRAFEQMLSLAPGSSLDRATRRLRSRRTDGEPGVIRLRRGRLRLQDIAATWHLVNDQTQLVGGEQGLSNCFIPASFAFTMVYSYIFIAL